MITSVAIRETAGTICSRFFGRLAYGKAALNCPMGCSDRSQLSNNPAKIIGKLKENG
jgi:hypothetical protein